MREPAIAAGFMLLCSLVLGNQSSYSNQLPVVDLGYELHQAASYNETGNFYNFSNIRYAAPPVGELRFASPQPPAANRSAVNTGSVGRVCPQANPAWLLLAAQFLQEYLQGLPININTTVLSGGSNKTIQLDPRTTEDCLFLDVLVPKPIVDSRYRKPGAPVLVWIYGGGYTTGDKSALNGGGPSGLIHRSNDSIIYVALNYRLGAFGWLSGPTFQQNGTANAGLHDQRFALEWVQRYIHLFGGDPGRVTVMGESAGGGSIVHQITAYGGLKGPVPFQQAIPQSPGFSPVTSNLQQETVFQTFLGLLNVSTLEEARQLPTAALIRANIIQVANASYGGFGFGPAVDGHFVPLLPGELLAQGRYDKNLKLLIGHNLDEGLIFTSPFITNQTTYAASLQAALPDASSSVLNYIDTVLYPPVFTGQYGYTDEISRTAVTVAELVFTCNTFFLDLAYGNQTYAYQFSILPALHGDDLTYTFYNDGGLRPPNLARLDTGLQNVTVALALQDWIVTFTRDGVPSSPDVQGIPKFTVYGPDAMIEDLNLTRITQTMDPAADPRCRWWQKALYY